MQIHRDSSYTGVSENGTLSDIGSIASIISLLLALA
jgi:hypothetical protein